MIIFKINQIAPLFTYRFNLKSFLEKGTIENFKNLYNDDKRIISNFKVILNFLFWFFVNWHLDLKIHFKVDILAIFRFKSTSS